MTLKLVAPLVAASLLLAGCQSGHGTGGTGQSRAGGGPIGAGPGGPIGGDFGKSLDRADQAFMEQQINRALESEPTNQTSSWVNPDSQSQATVTPTRTFQQPNGTYCRDYSETVTINGQPEKATGMACRRPDGSWQTAG